jgi:hypothetical protein
MRLWLLVNPPRLLLQAAASALIRCTYIECLLIAPV